MGPFFFFVSCTVTNPDEADFAGAIEFWESCQDYLTKTWLPGDGPGEIAGFYSFATREAAQAYADAYEANLERFGITYKDLRKVIYDGGPFAKSSARTRSPFFT
jgi:hypothetical protein